MLTLFMVASEALDESAEDEDKGGGDGVVFMARRMVLVASACCGVVCERSVKRCKMKTEIRWCKITPDLAKLIVRAIFPRAVGGGHTIQTTIEFGQSFGPRRIPRVAKFSGPRAKTTK